MYATKWHNSPEIWGVCSNTPKYSSQEYIIYYFYMKMNIWTIFSWTKS